MAMPKTSPRAVKLAVILGGSGFVGRYVARRMAQRGWRVRVACRNPNEALFVRTYGVTGQVEPVQANIRDEASVAAVLKGADAVCNCVGLLEESGRNTFSALQAEGAGRLARLAREAGATAFVQISAIGADAASASAYARTKAEGERLVADAFPGAVILRPSIVFGPEDQFFNRFAAMARLGPVLPVVGASTKFQPVYVDDVAEAAARGLEGRLEPGLYELGGPEVVTFREMMDLMLDVIRRRRLVLGLPFLAGKAIAAVTGLGKSLTFGLAPQPITSDQVENLKRDNVVGAGMRGLPEIGIDPIAMDAVLPEYLWRFRKGGQYLAIKESARNLRD